MRIQLDQADHERMDPRGPELELDLTTAELPVRSDAHGGDDAGGTWIRHGWEDQYLSDEYLNLLNSVCLGFPI